MHRLLLITLTMAAGATSLDARNLTYSKLLDDASFCGDGGRFGTCLCDWFVIGGRWSGHLKENLLRQDHGQDYRDALKAEFPELDKDWVTRDLIEKHRDGLTRLWRRFGGHDGHPLTRSGYEELGFDDDAMLIDRPTYKHFLTRYEEQETADSEFYDLDYEAVDASFIGRKWLVVVDYHN